MVARIIPLCPLLKTLIILICHLHSPYAIRASPFVPMLTTASSFPPREHWEQCTSCLQQCKHLRHLTIGEIAVEIIRCGNKELCALVWLGTDSRSDVGPHIYTNNAELWLTYFTPALCQVGGEYGSPMPTTSSSLRLLAEKHGDTLRKVRLRMIGNVTKGAVENFVMCCPRLTNLKLQGCAQHRWPTSVGQQWLAMFPQLQYLSIDARPVMRTPLAL